MVVGKPNFNLNSFGIEYLSKEETQGFLAKREQGEAIRSAGEGGKNPRGTSGLPASQKLVGQERDHSSTSSLQQGKHTPSLAGSTQIDTTINTPSPATEPKAKPTKETIPNPQTREPMEGGTRSFFNSPTYGVKPYKPKIETEGKQEHIGSIIGEKNTDKVQGMDEKGNKRSISNIPERTEDEPKNNKGNKISESQTGGKKPSKLADAPQNVKGEEVKVSQKKIRVGVGEKAHEEMVKRDGVGEKRYAADRKSRYSKQAEEKRGRDDLKSRKLRYAQSEVIRLQRNQQTEKIGKSVNETIFKAILLKLDLTTLK